jgi:hypothetical protein
MLMPKSWHNCCEAFQAEEKKYKRHQDGAIRRMTGIQAGRPKRG